MTVSARLRERLRTEILPPLALAVASRTRATDAAALATAYDGAVLVVLRALLEGWSARAGAAGFALLPDQPVPELTDQELGPLRGLVSGLEDVEPRDLGTVYEALLGSALCWADGVLSVQPSGSRKTTGSYFTSEVAVDHLLDAVLEPALTDHLARVAVGAAELLDFRVVDLAMGSGHFLVAAAERVAVRLAGPGVPTSHLRRRVAELCLHGVDLDPVAVGLARLGLAIWTGVPDLVAPGLVHGDSLVGTAVEDAFAGVLERERTGFDVVLGNPPWDKVKVEQHLFWLLRSPGLKALPSAQQRRRIAELAAEHPDLVVQHDRERQEALALRAALASFPGMGTGDPDLSKAFAWRSWALLADGGRLGLVLPRALLGNQGSAAWRRAVLPHAQTDVVLCRNAGSWLFPDVNAGYPICLLAAHRTAGPPRLTLRGTFASADQLQAGLALPGAELDVSRLAARDPQLSVPALYGSGAVALFDRLLAHRSLGDPDRPDFRAVPATELHATADGRRLFTDRDTDAPVHNHTSLGHLAFDRGVRPFNHASWDGALCDLQARRAHSARNRSSPQATMPAGWADDPSTLPPLHPRIAFREVVHASNPRKVWAALVPAGVLLTHKAPYLLFPRGDERAQLFVLGLLGTSVVDWFGHLHVVLGLSLAMSRALPVPVLDPGDPRAARVVALAAGLAMPGPDGFGNFAAHRVEITDRADALAELDALAALLYGLTDDDLALVCSTAGRPRLAAVQQHLRRWA